MGVPIKRDARGRFARKHPAYCYLDPALTKVTGGFMRRLEAEILKATAVPRTWLRPPRNVV